MARQANSPAPQIAANFCGSMAVQALAERGTATVMGVTSRGIFLKAGEKQVVFLSYEDYRGPLTINLQGAVTPLRKATQGGLVQISPGQISIPGASLAISTQAVQIWQPQTPPLNAADLTGLHSRVKSFAQDVYTRKSGAGFSALLPALLDFPAEKSTEDKYLPASAALIRDGSLGFRVEPTAFFQLIEGLLGLGGGLTPSGDDFTLGLLLTLNRWGAILQWGGRQTFNEQVVHAAWEKTTTLSAELIKCAAMGLADERLINALDFLITGAGPRERILNGLLSWGNSSGVDVLAGIAAGISAKSP